MMPLAQASTVEILKIVAPLLLGGVGMLAIIIMVLTKHQRKMAEILHRPSGIPDAVNEEIRVLHQQMGRLEAKFDAVMEASAASQKGLVERLEATPSTEKQIVR